MGLSQDLEWREVMSLYTADGTKQCDLIMSWRQFSRHILYAVDTTLDSSSRIDWWEIMSWYPLDGTIFFVGSTTEQGPLDIADVTDSSWQWGPGHHFFSSPSRFQESRINMGLSQDLDWREVMSWYAVGGEAYTVRGTTQQEPGSIDAY